MAKLTQDMKDVMEKTRGYAVATSEVLANSHAKKRGSLTR